MSLATIGETRIIRRDPFEYNSHPCVAKLDNDEWIVAFKRAFPQGQTLHPTDFPLFHTMLTRTSDHGRTWTKPSVVPDFDWYGTEVPGVAQLSNGTVVVTHFRFGWYPLDLAKHLRANGKKIFLRLPDSDPFWTDQFGDEDWESSLLPWARGSHGLYAHVSTDRGHTFEPAVRIDCSPYQDGYNRTAVVELLDGRILHAVIEQHVDPDQRNLFVLSSATSGRTWEKPVLLAKPDGRALSVGEPHIAEVEPDELFCILRYTPSEGFLNSYVQTTGFLHSCRSRDGGQTWSNPEPTPLLGHPGHLLKLHDGRLLCTYGRRVAPFGVRACISADGGRSWLIDDEIVVAGEMPSSDVGYPTTIEYEPGRLFTAYYGRDTSDVTCVYGTYLDLN